MKLKEKCIYYNPAQEGYYLVLSIGDMIYGSSGDFVKASSLEEWISQDGPGIRFKIDDIIINSNYIRNYYLDDKCLEQFEFIRELTEEEFNLIEILSYSEYSFPPAVLDIDDLKNNKDVGIICSAIKDREEKIAKLNSEIYKLEENLYNTIYK